MSASPVASGAGPAQRGPNGALRQERAGSLMALLEEAFLAEMGFDPDRLVLAPAENHRLLVRPVCKVVGCSTTATTRRGICLACRRRLEAAGLSDDQLDLL